MHNDTKIKLGQTFTLCISLGKGNLVLTSEFKKTKKRNKKHISKTEVLRKVIFVQQAESARKKHWLKKSYTIYYGVSTFKSDSLVYSS